MFACLEDTAEGGDDEWPSDGWEHVGTFTVEGNGGQREARKQAFHSSPNFKEAMSQGGRVWFFCVPLSNFHPRSVGEKRSEPQLQF